MEHPYNIYHITRARKNYANYTQTRHSAPHISDLPCVTKCIVYALNYTQTIHKLYIETFQTLHKNYTRKPTPQLYILFFEHESKESSGWSEWSVRNESDVCDVRNERDGRNERTGETKGWVGDGLVTVSTGRHRGVTGAEFHHFI